jgi:hypothetical protein
MAAIVPQHSARREFYRKKHLPLIHTDNTDQNQLFGSFLVSGHQW